MIDGSSALGRGACFLQGALKEAPWEPFSPSCHVLLVFRNFRNSQKGEEPISSGFSRSLRGSLTMPRFVTVICPLKQQSFVGQFTYALQCGPTALLFKPTWTLFRSAVQESSFLKAPMSYHVGWQDELQLHTRVAVYMRAAPSPM